MCSRIQAVRRTWRSIWPCSTPRYHSWYEPEHGGHLTHGASVNFSGKIFKSVSYGVKQDTGYIDYEEARKLALEMNPKMIVVGASAYSRIIDFQAFAEIAQEVDAYLMADVAHIAGLIAAVSIRRPFRMPIL